MLALKDARVDMAVMTRDIENAQRAYDAVLGAPGVQQDRQPRETDQRGDADPGDRAGEAGAPEARPDRGLSVLVGALLAAGMVYLLETLDRRVRSRTDLESRLAVPSLGRLSRWQPTGGRLLPCPVRTARALPHPW